MAITNYTSSAGQQQLDGNTITWTAVPNGNQGQGVAGPWFTANFTVSGTFGVGGSVQIEGSNDNVNFFKLSPAALTAGGLFTPLGATEHPKYVRPNVTAGDGTTAITVVGFFTYTPGAY